MKHYLAIIFNVVYAPFIIYISRIFQMYLLNSINYMICHDSIHSVSSFQIEREKSHVLEGFKIHFLSSMFLLLLFPSMFNNDNNILECLYYTLLSHIIIVEPLYYIIHRLLHIKQVYKIMHYFHHLSHNTIPSTALVQNFKEHFIYIGTFGPALFIPYFIFGRQHWICIYAYLMIFDFVNALGHCDFSYCDSYYTSNILKFLFYSPEFHRTHHKYLTSNYALFMPIWDKLFGTYKDSFKNKSNKQVDFVFIGHNFGVFHLLSLPQMCIYNIYNELKIYYNIYIDFKICQFIRILCDIMGISHLNMPKFKILNGNIGQIIGLSDTPLDYLQNKRSGFINGKIIGIIMKMNLQNGTQYFGLGNLNKMKTLNDGGVELASSLNHYNSNIKILTGDTMTVASIYHSLLSKNIDNIFFIGGTGKIGKALCTLLINRNCKTICLYTSNSKRFQEIKDTLSPELHNKLTFTSDLKDISKFTNIIIGKQLQTEEIKQLKQNDKQSITIYDYNVPFIPIMQHNIKYIQIGILENKNKDILDGYFDISFGLKQRQIYPCYAGCLLGFMDKRDTNEVGEINIEEVDYYWRLGEKYGFTLVIPSNVENDHIYVE